MVFLRALPDDRPRTAALYGALAPLSELRARVVLGSADDELYGDDAVVLAPPTCGRRSPLVPPVPLVLVLGRVLVVSLPPPVVARERVIVRWI